MILTYTKATKLIARAFAVSEQSLVSSFQAASIEDLDAIASLRQRVFGSDVGTHEEDVSYLRWRYFDRPEYDSTLWICKLDGRLLGVLGTEPVELSMRDQGRPEETVAAVRNMDAALDPSVDGSGLGAWMTLAMQNLHDIVIATGGNEKSTSMLNRLFTALAVRRYFKVILSSKDFLRSKLPSPIASLAAPMLDWIIRLKLARNRITELGVNRTLKTLTIVDFLAEYPGDFDNGLAEIRVKRTPDYYQWRLARTHIDYRVCAVYAEAEMVGYLVYAIRAGASKSAYVIDWDVRDSVLRTSDLSAMFAEMIHQCSAEHVDEITCILNDRVSAESAAAAGFIERNTKQNFFVSSQHAAYLERLSNKEAWLHSYIDTDGL